MSVIVNNKRYRVKNQKDNESLLVLRKKKIEDIRDILGLDKLVNLLSLILDDNYIKEIEGLSMLTNLKKLSLKNNRIEEIKGLDNLTQLEDLNLEGNKITEIKGLENLRDLKYLNLWDNNISELKGLHKQTKLKSLRLYGNPVDIWVKAKLGPQENLTNAAVNYCRKLVKDIAYDKNELNSFLEQNWDNAIKAIFNEDYILFMRILKEVYNKVNIIDNEILYNFFGKILNAYPKMFNKNFSKDYHFYITKFLPLFTCFEMERYILKNYCFYENEIIISSFLGYITFNNIRLIGRIHVTNLRIIIFGNFQREDNSEDLLFGIGWAFLFEIIDQIDMNLMKKTINSLNSGKTTPKFGYEIPLFNPINVRYNQRSISFDLVFPKKFGKKKVFITIIPKEILKGVNKKEYNDNYELLIDIYDFICSVK